LIVERGDQAVQVRLRSAADLAPLVTASPLRYVLTDEVTIMCAELAFSTGTRLVDCLDLVRVPATSLWVEWDDSVAQAAAADHLGKEQAGETPIGSKAGVHLQASREGRTATLSSLWSLGDEALASPVEAKLDFSNRPFRDLSAADPFRGGWIAVTDAAPELDQVLGYARFRFEASWARYYRDSLSTNAQRASVIRKSLGGVALSIPLVIAFLLLLASGTAIASRHINRDSLNKKRLRSGKPPLLNHVEASLGLTTHIPSATVSTERDSQQRHSPRHHHVRGHLVRRQNTVFWRRPHSRGNIVSGAVLSRTVTLRFGELAPQ
jgi:hypothetical protein